MKTIELDRRQFLRSAALGSAGALIASSSKLMAGYSKPAPPTDEKKIIKRKLGTTGIELPVVSMGVMRADNAALIPAAMKTGIVHFDTAHGYQDGRNEEMLGEVFKDYLRNSFIVATKVPPEEVDNATGLLKPGSTSKAFLEKLDVSLKRLKLDYVDILYVHGISARDAALFPSMLEAVREAKKSGKAKHVGLSTHKNEPEVIQAAIDSGIYEIVLTALNYRQDNYQEMKRVIAKAADAGIGIIAMKTMAGAYLDKERKKPINCKAALKFVLQDEHVTTAIPGSPISTSSPLMQASTRMSLSQMKNAQTLRPEKMSEGFIARDVTGAFPIVSRRCQFLKSCGRTCTPMAIRMLRWRTRCSPAWSFPGIHVQTAGSARFNA